MATVFLAQQEIFEREVALKVMSRALAEDPAFGQRFFREAKIVSQLVHPNIVTVHDVGMHNGYYYLSMEHIDGKDLKHARKNFSLRQKIRTIRDIAKALEYAGSKGYVHRDIKPENIMFHTSDGRAVLMDFGIARAAETDASMTQTGTAIGTPHYMSPEQAKGKTVDHRSDIYSLGVVFYLLLTGKVPYDAESAVAIGIKHITEEVPGLPRGLEGMQRLIDRMMAKRLSERFQSASELIDELDELDVTLLEHTENIAQHSSDSFGAQDTLVSDGTGNDMLFDADGHSGESEQFTLMYDTQVDMDEVQSRRWPWLLGILLILALGGGGFYTLKPELSKNLLGSALKQGQALWSSFGDFVEPYIEPDEHSSDIISPAPDPISVTSEAENDKPVNTAVNAVDKNIVAKDADVSRPPSDVPVSDDKQGDLIASMAEVDQAFNSQRLSVLKEKIKQLTYAVDADPASMAQLVEAYREAFGLAPSDQALREKFAILRNSEFQKVKGLAKSGKATAVEKKLVQLSYLFPEITDKEIADVNAELARQRRIAVLLKEAEGFVGKNALTQPAKNNAVARYRHVLELERENPVAKQGLVDISDTLTGLARDKYKQDNLSAALNFAAKALTVNPANGDAKRLEARIVDIQTKKRRVKTLLADAERKVARGQLFGASSAYSDYRAVLQIETKNSLASKGIETVVDQLSSTVWQLVGDEQFLQAKELLTKATQQLPKNERVQSLSLAVDEVIGEKILSLEPRIHQLLVSGEPISEVAGPSSVSFPADRSIFLGFRYEHFQETTSVIQAILLDGAGRVQIAQVPVVVEGAQGAYTFSIDRPVEGFPAGSYTVDLRLGDETLNSTVFKVE